MFFPVILQTTNFSPKTPIHLPKILSNVHAADLSGDLESRPRRPGHAELCREMLRAIELVIMYNEMAFLRLA